MKVMLLVLLCLMAFASAGRRSYDVVDFELDDQEQEVEGRPGKAIEGEYSWTAPNGNEYYVKYKADNKGYRIIEDNVIPKVDKYNLPVGASEEED